MKTTILKKLFFISVISTSLFAIEPGSIETKFNQINLSGSEYRRIEMKLDLIIEKLIQKEQASAARAETVENITDKAKTSIKKGLSFLSEKIK
ncbi:hypothetical protein HOG47_03095 [archaeon]|nr:hypothetical protein [archaeon]